MVLCPLYLVYLLATKYCCVGTITLAGVMGVKCKLPPALKCVVYIVYKYDS